MYYSDLNDKQVLGLYCHFYKQHKTVNYVAELLGVSKQTLVNRLKLINKVLRENKQREVPIFEDLPKTKSGKRRNPNKEKPQYTGTGILSAMREERQAERLALGGGQV